MGDAGNKTGVVQRASAARVSVRGLLAPLRNGIAVAALCALFVPGPVHAAPPESREVAATFDSPAAGSTVPLVAPQSDADDSTGSGSTDGDVRSVESPTGSAAARAEGPRPESPHRSATPPVSARIPDGYAAMAFENRSGFATYDWMNAAVPFVLAEKLEQHPSLRPAYGTLVLDAGEPRRVTPARVAEFARAHGARWVWTGWFNRLKNWDMQLGVSLWRVSGNSARRVGEVVGRDDFKHVHDLVGVALEKLCADAGMPLRGRVVDAVRRHPTDDHYAFTLFGRGVAFLSGVVGWVDLPAARKNLERTIFIDPNFAEAHRLLAELYRRTGQLRMASERLGAALALRGDYYSALVAAAAEQTAAGDLERVRIMDTAMLHQRPWDLERRYHLGKVLWEVGDVAGSLLELDRVVTMRPNDIRARRILVLVHASLGQSVDLVTELEKVSALDPGHVPTRLDLAAAYSAAGRPNDAISAYLDILRLDPGNAVAMKLVADQYNRQKNRAMATRYYAAAMRANPRDPRPYFRLGALYVSSNRDRRAKRVYRRAQRFPRYLGRAWSNLGAIAYREGKLDEALWYLLRAVKKSPHNVTVRFNLALALSAKGEVDRALRQADAGLRMAPKHPGLHYVRGVALLRRGDAAGAKRAFASTIALQPSHEDARHNLARLELLSTSVSGANVSEFAPVARGTALSATSSSSTALGSAGD